MTTRVSVRALALMVAVVALSGCTAPAPDDLDTAPPPAPTQLFEGDCDRLLALPALTAPLAGSARPTSPPAADGAGLAVQVVGGVRCAWADEQSLLDLWVLPVAADGGTTRDSTCVADGDLTRCVLEFTAGSVQYAAVLTETASRAPDELEASLQSIVIALPPGPSDDSGSSASPAGVPELPGCRDDAFVDTVSSRVDGVPALDPVDDTGSVPSSVRTALEGLHVTCELASSGLSITLVAGGAFLVPTLPAGEVVELEGASYARTGTPAGEPAVTVAIAGDSLVVARATTAQTAQQLATAGVAVLTVG